MWSGEELSHVYLDHVSVLRDMMHNMNRVATIISKNVVSEYLMMHNPHHIMLNYIDVFR